MNMVTIKTAELTGAALDWAVAKAEGNEVSIRNGCLWIPTECYSTDWSQGGPIIEREELSIAKVGRSLDDAMAPHPDCWCAHIDGAYAMYGPTPLIAAMRCYVTSKLGNEVEIPKELS